MDGTQATTQTGAAGLMDSTESQFESFYNAGAFEPSGEPPKESQGADQSASSNADQTAQTGQQDDATTQHGQGDDPTAQTEQGAEAPTYESLDALLTSLKVDPTSVMKLHVTTKIDGVETQVPLEQVLKSYQLEGHVNNKSIELSNQRAAFEQERQAFRTAFQQQFTHNQNLGNLALQMLNHDYQKVDWGRLRVENPAEFAAMQSDFQQRQGQIQNHLAQLQQQQALAQQHQQTTLQQSIAAENERMLGLRPEWRDRAAFAKDKDQMTQYARGLGFKDAELSQIFDHRYMLILHDAARYQALQANAPQALKQVRQAPVVAKPGSRTDVNPQEARRAQAVERFNRNPRDIDAQTALFDTFG
ncbi:hypothetical protein [Pararobbsia silviterrae]|uniref:Uncharacterized protein n=1 Tax=Pararobbsia silviterrae TaxID=1792498 RepID=A0A494Y2X8_9BURK|nr:hypothetical protein [Pararobbsia silviterrae]RKP56368.1 hypothetical protein D7S86_08185 [Pararobbsia silviterrae]